MNKEQLFAAMNGIDEAILERSEKNASKKNTLLQWTALAACFCLIIAAFTLLPRSEEQPQGDASGPILQPEPTVSCHDRQWTVRYNEEERIEMDYQRALPAGYFNEALTARQLDMILPQKQLDLEIAYSRAYFFYDGTVDKVFLQLAVGSETINITLGNYFTCCIHSPEDPVVSRCGNVEYEIYRYDLKNRTLLEADTKLGDVPLHFSMETKSPEQGMQAFEAVLECFSWYDTGKPALSDILPSRIPEFVSEKLDSLLQAQQDPDFGRLMPQNGPDGFAVESFRRYKDYYSNYLSGLWTKGYAELSWQVSAYSDDAASRITSVADTVNYDLSLYPIPRADSVPEQLREIVNDPIFLAEELTLEAVQARTYTVEDAGEGGTSCRMNFSVKYGDCVVTVWSKGIEPQWLYDQLTQLRE